MRLGIRSAWLSGSALLLSWPLAVGAEPEGRATAPVRLAPPVRIEAAGTPIDVDVGHAAPFVNDWNGDGKPDLLVGQFGGGQLRIYVNVGEPGVPRFGEPTWLEVAGQKATIPAG